MKLPRHLAIIMDGNGRWAQVRGKPRTFGHIKGARVAKQIITECSNLGMSYLTLYAFSSENWLRPEAEVSFLMNLLRRYLKKETQNLVKQNIRFDTIGQINLLPKDLIESIEYAKNCTAKNTGLVLTFAISYGSRTEIVTAARMIAEKVKMGLLDVESIDEQTVSENLETSNIPDPDLILRTSGENRLSNFLLWQAAYSEFYFCSTLWPDFTTEDLHSAFDSFQSRKRRFGGIEDHEIHPN